MFDQVYLIFFISQAILLFNFILHNFLILIASRKLSQMILLLA